MFDSGRMDILLLAQPLLSVDNKPVVTGVTGLWNHPTSAVVSLQPALLCVDSKQGLRSEMCKPNCKVRYKISTISWLRRITL